jgi:T5SS/PEP-CTERM-associated repeat protein
MAKRQSWIAAAVAAGLSGVSPFAFATDNVWTGATSQDWNDPTNWSLGRVPVQPSPASDGFDDAVVNVNANFPRITADLAAVPRDIIVGQGAGAQGRVDHSAGLATTGNGNWLYIGRDAGSGVYNLANTGGGGGTLTGFGMGTGSIDVGGGPGHSGTAGRVYVGGTEFGNTGLNGTFNVNTSGTLTIRNDLNVGTDGGNGTMLVDAGTITTGGWNFFGKRVNKDGAQGLFNMSGGTLTNSGRTYVAQTTTTATMILSGGTYSQNDLLIIGEGVNSHGTVNVTSAASTLTVNSEIWVGQAAGGNGAMNVSAGTVTLNNWLAVGRESATGVLTVSGNGVVNKIGGGQITIGTGAGGNGTVNVSGNGTLSTNNDLIVAENNATAIGTFNQTGGTVAVGGNLEVQRTGTGTYNMSGGTLSVNGNIDGVDGTFAFTGGRITRGNAGVINYSGNLTVLNKLAGFALGTDKTFNVTGTLNVTAGNTFDVTGQALPAAGGGVQTGMIHLGNDGLIVGTFDPLLTSVAGLSNPAGAAFISETQGEGGLFNPNTQSVFWVQENAGSVDLKYSIAPVPEPTALGFIAIGGLALAARRRGRK